MATPLTPKIVLCCALLVPLRTRQSYLLPAIKDMALRCARGGLIWILTKISSLKGCLDIVTAYPGKWWSHHVKNVVLGDTV